jgi:hypothetical protein
MLKSTVFWDITPCSPSKVNRRFRGRSPPSSGSNKPSKILVLACKQVAAAWALYLQNHRCENLKSYTWSCSLLIFPTSCDSPLAYVPSAPFSQTPSTYDGYTVLVVSSCSSECDRCFGGTCRFHLHGQPLLREPIRSSACVLPLMGDGRPRNWCSRPPVALGCLKNCHTDKALCCPVTSMWFPNCGPAKQWSASCADVFQEWNQVIAVLPLPASFSRKKITCSM